MTNSVIPYSFIPGTKAKAGEVNANFIALVNLIDANKQLSLENILEAKEQIIEIMADKADKDELINDFTVSTTQTNLNNYKTPGTYIFSSQYTPTNIPKGNSGTLVVAGSETSTIKQIWYCDGVNSEIFTRNFQNSQWSAWSSNIGSVKLATSGYLKFPNGLLIQWGKAVTNNVTYPIAFGTLACPICTKNGVGTGNTRSDTGIQEDKLTGLTFTTAGTFYSLNYIVLGY